MTKEDVALRIFCAFLSRFDAKVSPWPDLGENEIRVAFTLADTFMKVRAERGSQPTDERLPPREPDIRDMR